MEKKHPEKHTETIQIWLTSECIKYKFANNVTLSWILCPTISLSPSQQIQMLYTWCMSEPLFNAFLRFPIHIHVARRRRQRPYVIFSFLYTDEFTCTHRMSTYFIPRVVHVQKDLFKWIMFIHCWITHTDLGFFFVLSARKIVFEKDLHSIRMNITTNLFKFTIDSIIFAQFFCRFLYTFVRRFFMITFQQRNKKKLLRTTSRIICDYILASKCPNPQSKWFGSCVQGKTIIRFLHCFNYVECGIGKDAMRLSQLSKIITTLNLFNWFDREFRRVLQEFLHSFC